MNQQSAISNQQSAISNQQSGNKVFLRKLQQISIQVLAILLLFSMFTACNKDYMEAETEYITKEKMNGQQNAELLESYRWISPYSMKTIRAIREAAITINDTLVQQRLAGTLKPSNYYLYYKITPNTESKIQNLNEWLEADSNRIIIAAPIDSISMFPSHFSEAMIDEMQEKKEIFYTTISLSEPLPLNLGAEILDTLYVPDSTEVTLDFMINLYTANFSNSFLNTLATQHPKLYQSVASVITRESFLIPDYRNNEPHARLPDYPPGVPNYHIEFMRDMTGDMESSAGSGGGIGSPIRTGGRITFEETTLEENEGIKNLKVIAFRFLLLPYFRTTDNEGHFSTSLPGWGYVGLVYSFGNSELKIRNLDLTSSWIIDALEVIRHLMQFSIPESHIAIVDPGTNINLLNTHFAHGTQKALWGLTFNAIQEANAYADVSDIYSFSPIDKKFLNVLCYYNTSKTAAAAPMFNYLGTGVGVDVDVEVTNIIFHTLGLSSLMNKTIGGILPDIIISQRLASPIDSRQLRQNVYHEYGHSRHYFKANKYSNAHWLANISKTLSSGEGEEYGNNINNSPGNFFALSEGWADFIGYNFAARKYPAPMTVWDGTRNTENTAWIYSNTSTYINHLENNPTFYNSFIPRGLFHDLMDGPDDEDFDNIQGYTILQIYNRFNDATWTIQKFRERWEAEYPSMDNEDLFEEYNIDLP